MKTDNAQTRDEGRLKSLFRPCLFLGSLIFPFSINC